MQNINNQHIVLSIIKIKSSSWPSNYVLMSIRGVRGCSSMGDLDWEHWQKETTPNFVSTKDEDRHWLWLEKDSAMLATQLVHVYCLLFIYKHFLPCLLPWPALSQRSALHNPRLQSWHGSWPQCRLCGGRRGEARLGAGCSAEIGCCRREAGTSLCSWQVRATSQHHNITTSQHHKCRG